MFLHKLVFFVWLYYYNIEFRATSYTIVTQLYHMKRFYVVFTLYTK